MSLQLPPQPWDDGTEPAVEQLAGWFLSLTRPQLEHVLSRQRAIWRDDSRCFEVNHHGEIERLSHQVLTLSVQLQEANLELAKLRGAVADAE